MQKNEDKIAELIEKSGNDFHLKVGDLLEALGWSIQISPYFNDPVTGKARELDIIATKKYKVRDSFFDLEEDIKIQLFIECKYVNEDMVFWKRARDKQKTDTLIKGNHLLKEVHFDPKNEPTHHYLVSEEVIKLGAKSGKTDVLYEGMNGCLNALIFFRQNSKDAMYTANYPLIVIDSFEKVYERDTSSEKGYKQITTNPQLEVDYSFLDQESNHKTEYFLIDIVPQNNLATFLNYLESNDVALLKQGTLEKLYNRGRNLRQRSTRTQTDFW